MPSNRIVPKSHRMAWHRIESSNECQHLRIFIIDIMLDEVYVCVCLSVCVLFSACLQSGIPDRTWRIMAERKSTKIS